MKKYKIVFLFVVVFSISSFASIETIIKGRISNHKEHSKFSTISSAHRDYATGKQITSVASINALGEFEIKFHLDFSKNLYLLYGNKLVTLFLIPGNELIVNLNANKFFNIEKINLQSVLTFDGDDKEINENISKYLTEYNQQFISLYEKHLKVKNLSLNEYISYRYELMKDEQNFLNKFCIRNEVKKQFKKWCKFEIEYGCANDLMRYRWEHEVANGIDKNTTKNMKSNPDGYTDSLDDFEMDNPDALISTKYIQYLHEWELFFVFNKYSTLNSFWAYPIAVVKSIFYGREKVKLDYSMDFITSFPEMFSGIALDITLSNYLYNTLSKQPNLDVVEKQMEYYNSIVSNQSIKNTINSYYNKTKRFIEESVLTPQMVIKKNNENSGTIFIQNLIKENKGKVIYLDFWAPWCQPCRKQMKFSHDLKKKFENNDVIFIYLCVNSPEKKWKEGIATLKLEGQNYLLNNSQHNFLSQEFNISGIPHYVLVNKNGVIVDKDAKRPELGGNVNSKLVSQINNLLSEEK